MAVVTMPDSNTQDQGEDPYNFIFDHSHISALQEQYLRDLSVGARSHHSPSTSRASVDSPIVPLDVFHTPPENTSPPSFCDQPTTVTECTECDHRCTINHANDVDAATQGFVHLSEGLNLGFSEGDMGSEKASWPSEVVDVFKALLEFTEEEEINLEDFTYLK